MAGYYDEETGQFIETGDVGQLTGPLPDTTGTGNLPGWTYEGGVWKDPSGSTYDLNYLNTTPGFLANLGKLFSGTSSLGMPGQIAGLAGLAALLNRATGGGGSQFAGYQGGIPQYTATRTQTPLEQQRPAGYRPGQGGITYFSPMQYSPVAAAAAPTGSGTTTDQTETDGKAAGGYMPSGIAMLAKGGGRFLRGPGDGVSDSIPATIADRQPARLADGEFVVDARTVSELGNGSSEAGARKLYEMMDRVHKARRTAKRGKPSGADKYLPK